MIMLRLGWCMFTILCCFTDQTSAKKKQAGKKKEKPVRPSAIPIPSSLPSNAPSNAPSSWHAQLDFTTVHASPDGRSYSGTIGANDGLKVPEGTPECGTTVTTPVKWFRLEGEGKKVVAKTIEPTNFDTKLVVYTKDDLQQCVGGNDDMNWPLERLSKVSWEADLGEFYYILVAGFVDLNGDFTLSISSP